jgi:hypothetical protein
MIQMNCCKEMFTKTKNGFNEHNTSALLQRNVYRNKKKNLKEKKKPKQ